MTRINGDSFSWPIRLVAHYHDYQPPRLYRTGVSLRRSYLTGAADTQEESMMKRLLERFDEQNA